jgi:transcriptional regulator with XRE-family HTH domain
MTEDRKGLGARLREAREYLGLSQDEVAKAVALPRSAISLIESGQRRIDALELKKFAELYQRPVGEFTGELEATSLLEPSVQYLARAAAQLTSADQAELIRFAEFLRMKTATTRQS